MSLGHYETNTLTVYDAGGDLMTTDRRPLGSNLERATVWSFDSLRLREHQLYLPRL